MNDEIRDAAQRAVDAIRAIGGTSVGLDESHEHDSTALIEVMIDSKGARHSPLTIIVRVTT